MISSTLIHLAGAMGSGLLSVGALVQFLDTAPAVDNVLVRCGLVALAVLLGCATVWLGSRALELFDGSARLGSLRKNA